MIKLVGTTMAGLALAAAGVAGVGAESADAALPRCLAQVIVYEDGSWAGGQVTIDGRVNADRWIVTGPRFQGQRWPSRITAGKVTEVTRNFAFPPTFAGQECQIYVGR